MDSTSEVESIPTLPERRRLFLFVIIPIHAINDVAI